MRLLVISNDVVPGFDVPVAAPGLRAHGLAEGLRSHGIDARVAAPAHILASLPDAATTAPPHTTVVAADHLQQHIVDGGFDVVVFTNANLTPFLEPIPGVRFVYDLFAPKLLERLASSDAGTTWDEQVAQKERALALADTVWVNGRRKLGYAAGWLLRTGVAEWRQRFGKPSLIGSAMLADVQVVDMPIALPNELEPSIDRSTPGAVGVAGYAQQWSQLPTVHPAHQAVVDAGLDLHVLVPRHWGAGNAPTPTSVFPTGAHTIEGPLEFEAFGRWVQSMQTMVDVFTPTDERYFAMITRTVVALRLGVPVLHGVDSEVADLITAANAGWVVTGNNPAEWRRVVDEMRDPDLLETKRNGALELTRTRFSPHAALRDAASHLLDG